MLLLLPGSELVNCNIKLPECSLMGPDVCSTHGDMSPKYAGALLGLTNTSGALAGIIGVSAVGILFDATGSWDAALMLPNIALMLAGSACFTFLGKNEPVDFDLLDNSPLAIERWLQGPRRAATALVTAAVHAIEAALPAPPPEVVEAAKRARRTARRAAQRVAQATDSLIHPGAPPLPSPVDSLLEELPAVSSSRGPLSPTSGYERPSSAYSSSSASMSSFSGLVTSSLSGIHGRGDGGRQSPTLVSHWTAASIMPDFDEESSYDDEYTEAEEEVARIIDEMKKRQEEGRP